MIHSILPVQITCLAIFFAQPLSTSSLVYLLVWSPTPHIPYISSLNQCLLLATHAHTTAVVSILYHLFYSGCPGKDTTKQMSGVNREMTVQTAYRDVVALTDPSTTLHLPPAQRHKHFRIDALHQV